MRWLPVRSLRGQTLLIMLMGLLISHGVAIAIYSDDRGNALTLIEAEDMAERIAGMVLLISQLPSDLHEPVAQASSTSTFRVSVDTAPALEGTSDQDEEIEALVGPYLRDLVARLAPDWSLVTLRDVDAGTASGITTSISTPGNAPDSPSTDHHYVLSASIQGESGEWLNFVTRIPERRTPWPEPVGYHILTLTFVVLALSVWSVGRVTRPLEAFAQASEELGKNIAKTPLREEGPVEIMKAASALNAMQDRLKRLIENRTQMLAAISHDLRTPVTLLRLRAELLEKQAEREKFLATLDEMDLMIASFLDFARHSVEFEPQRLVDVSALLDSICGDLLDGGFPVAAHLPEKSLAKCRPQELRRALTNLIDNAMKYGGGARVSLSDRSQAVEIRVEDDGPGIPEDRLDTICMPFVRGEASRNPESGGIGLGLSIARSVIEAHGGQLQLSNRTEGGLLARVTLPK